MFLILLLIIGSIIVAIYAMVTQAQFGRHPDGERLERILISPNYKNGEFQNTVPTPLLIEGESFMTTMWKNLFSKKVRPRPEESLPTVRLDLKALDAARDMVIWLGHSSYYIHLGGKRILVDPVFSGYGAPFSFFNKTFPGTDVYSAPDMPEIDYLIISHDHWDHLDYQTVTDMMTKVKTVIMPLGVGAHFEHWGYPKNKLQEADWNTALPFEGGFVVHAVPARHFSGRTLTRNKALWAGFVLETPKKRIFLSGDTGYGPHFADIARTFGGFDLVALDGGQYDPRWPLVHMNPEEVAQAAEELEAGTLMLAHAGRFTIAEHPWDEPFVRVSKASKGRSFQLLTPKIGEPVWLDGTEQVFTNWWEGIQ